jgi:hypothetical protein
MAALGYPTSVTTTEGDAPAAVGSAMTLTAAYDAAKTAATQTSVDALATATGTPLQASAYTAPPTPATVATAVRTELATELARVDVAVSTRSTLTAAQVWSATTRTLTEAAGLTTEQAAQLAALKAQTAPYIIESEIAHVGSSEDAAKALADLKTLLGLVEADAEDDAEVEFDRIEVTMQSV